MEQQSKLRRTAEAREKNGQKTARSKNSRSEESAEGPWGEHLLTEGGLSKKSSGVGAEQQRPNVSGKGTSARFAALHSAPMRNIILSERPVSTPAISRLAPQVHGPDRQVRGAPEDCARHRHPGPGIWSPARPTELAGELTAFRNYLWADTLQRLARNSGSGFRFPSARSWMLESGARRARPTQTNHLPLTCQCLGKSFLARPDGILLQPPPSLIPSGNVIRLVNLPSSGA